MKLSKCILLLHLVLCGLLSAHAQRLNFENITTRNGLSANEVTCIYEDNEHFLWIGTRDGLNRFDGRTFKIFRNIPGNSNSISGNYVVSITQDKKGILWIATKDGGLTRYDKKATRDAQFRQFRHNPKDSTSIATNRLICLYDWDENYLMIGAEVVPAIFINKKTFAFSYANLDAPKLSPQVARQRPSGINNWIHHIEERDGQVYISTLLLARLFKVNKATGHVQNMHYDNSAGEGKNDLLSINYFFLQDTLIWMCGWNPGLYVQPNRPMAPPQRISPIDDLLNCIVNLDHNYLLAGTRASGLFLVNKNNGNVVPYQKRITNPHSIPSNKINCLFIDSRGIVWIGSSGGLSKFDKKVWLFNEREFTDPETDCTILHCHRFKDGSVAVNTSKGIFLSDTTAAGFKLMTLSNRGKFIVPDYILEANVSTVKPNAAKPYLKAAGDVLMGSEIGFYLWNKSKPALGELLVNGNKYPKPELFYGQGVFQVKQILADTVDNKPGYWLAVLGYGVWFYETNTGKLHSFMNDKANPQSIGSNLARRLTKDKQGNLWVATSSGLYKWNGKNNLQSNSFTHYLNEPDNKHSLPVNDVSDVWCDENNHLWLSLNGGGLAEFDGSKFTQYLPNNPLSSRSFFGMLPDGKRLWVITKNGLEAFDLTTKMFYHVDVNDGTPNSYLSPHFSNMVNGLVSFTAGNRVYSFQPSQLSFDTIYPAIYLAAMQVFGKDFLPEDLNQVVYLKPKENFIDFNISSLQFTSPGTVRFQYMLQGLDESWINSEDGQIKYTNLPWGEFVLKARVSNPSGAYGGETELVKFIIATPFYTTWWFILLCIAGISAIVYGIYKYRINQLLEMQKIRNKIARDLHDDIGSTLGSISFFSEAAKMHLQQDNYTGTEKMLGKIGETSREMIDNMSDIVWSVNPGNDTVKHLVERMRVFGEDLVASTDTRLHFECDETMLDSKLNMEQRKNIFLIFKETIYNSVKYAHCKNITINVKRTARGLQMQITDDGIGFDVNNYTSKNGNGLHNMRHRAEEIKGIYTITSGAGGTISTLTI